jgi:hypothetical protein
MRLLLTLSLAATISTAYAETFDAELAGNAHPGSSVPAESGSQAPATPATEGKPAGQNPQSGTSDGQASNGQKPKKRNSPEIEKACTELLSSLRFSAPSAEQSPSLLDEKRELENGITDAVDRSRGLNRATNIKGMQIFERGMSLLARGNVDELVTLIQPVRQIVQKNAKIIRDNKAKIEALGLNGNREEIATLEQEYQAASIPFGENYGTYVMFMSLVQSVAEGNGIGSGTNIPLQHRDGAENTVIFDLTSPAAVTAAKRVMGIVDPRVEMRWLPNMEAEVYSPSVEELRTIFSNNIYALIAKLRRDLDEQKKDQRWWVKTIRLVADAYMNITSIDFIPEKYRKWVLRLTGIPYDQFMLERYLDKIQAVVEVARVHSKEGKVLLSTDQETMNLQIKTLLEFDSQAIGDDLLITFARIGYHTDTWVNLLKAVQAKAGPLGAVVDAKDGKEGKDGKDKDTAKDTKDPKDIKDLSDVKDPKEPKKPAPTNPTGTVDPNNPYGVLYQRMVTAQKRAKELGGVTYIYEPAISYKAMFAGLQITYLLATEEVIRNWAGSYFTHLFHYLF